MNPYFDNINIRYPLSVIRYPLFEKRLKIEIYKVVYQR
jgi:hypothetical protein